MDSEELKKRTKEFALRIIKLVGELPNSIEGRKIGEQILKSGTSVGANYKSACRAKSKLDFIYKINIVEEEADETSYWLEIILEAGLFSNKKLEPLIKESNELTAIFTATGKSAKLNKRI